MAKHVKIMCVCGSGTVTSAIVATKLRDKLKEYDYDVEAVESSVMNIPATLSSGGFSLIACASPVADDYGIPKLNAIGLVTGMGEDKVYEACLKILEGN